MRIKLLVIICVMHSSLLYSQVIKTMNIANQSALMTEPLLLETNKGATNTPLFNYIFQNIANKEYDTWGATEEIKEKNKQKKLCQIQKLTNNFKKTRGNAPTIGKKFRSNELETFTPTDNSLAISKDGIIISCDNFTVEYYDTNGTKLTPTKTWADFVNNNPTLTEAKFDPRVIYDAQRDRFIITILHGFSSSKSKEIVAFSKTNNPVDGWWIYKLSGNPLQDSSWTDYPTIGISNNDLFINGNLWKDNYIDYNQTFIYQIGLDSAYAGKPLEYQLWNQIFSPDGYKGGTLYPAQHGNGAYLNEKMYFVETASDSGSHVYVFEINGKLTSSNKQMNAYMYPIPHFDVCADAYEKDPTTGIVDSLSTGGAWIENAIYTKNTLHFTFSANVNGWCGIKYGRIDLLSNNTATIITHSVPGQDLCYPALATMAIDSNDKSVAIAYLRTDTTFLPGIEIIAVDNNNTFSNSQVVKHGDTSVNILFPPTYGLHPTERWGDYTGIYAKYNATIPEVWLGAAFGANNPVRQNSYASYVAQIIRSDTGLAIATNNITTTSQFQLFPNPVTDKFYMDFTTQKDAETIITLYNSQGQVIRNLLHDKVRAGNNKLSFNKLALAKGVYYIQVQIEQEKPITKLLTVE